MKRYSITFGNGIYFDCFTAQGRAIQVGPFTQAWSNMSLDEINTTMDTIKHILPDAQLSIVTHEPVPFKEGE